MTPSQYRAALDALGWTHARMGEAIGKSERASFRYVHGQVRIPRSVAKHIRLLLRLRMTESRAKFDELVNNL